MNEWPFKTGCFYDAQAVAAAFVSAAEPVSVRTVHRWIERSPVLHGARVVVAGRAWLPGAALLEWLRGQAARQSAPERDERGVFVAARSEGELRRKLEAAHG